jgi:DNA-binding transcriptional regulator YiaG
MHLDDVEKISRARSLAASGEGRSKREGVSVTMRELASAIGVDAATLSRWETGTTAPRGPAAIRWLDALETLEVGGSR